MEFELVEAEEVDGDVEDDRGIEGDSEDINLKCLIAVVKANPALYAKNKKQYSGKNFNKSLAWSSVGQGLSPPISGEDAEKIWTKLRQKFGKEWRKHKQSVCGRSGSASKPVYASQWFLFHDLMFLSDHIEPRRTVSNYVSKPKPTASQPSGTPIISWTADLLSPSGGDSSDHSSNPSTSSCGCRFSMGSVSSSSSVSETLSRSSSPFVAPTSPASPSLPKTSQGMSASAQVLAAMNSALGVTPKRTAPEPDSFAQKKRKLEETFMTSIMESNKAMTTVAEKIVGGSNAAVSAPAQAPDPILSAIQVAFENVPQEKKFPCMMRVLTVIQNEFCQ